MHTFYPFIYINHRETLIYGELNDLSMYESFFMNFNSWVKKFNLFDIYFLFAAYYDIPFSYLRAFNQTGYI